MGYTRAMAETWPILFLAVVLKVPAIGMIWLVLWAAKGQPEPEAPGSDEDGGSRRGRIPFGPRRGGPVGPGDCTGGPEHHEGRSRQAGRKTRSRERSRSREISRR